MARKTESQRIPRPPNAFILYRSHMKGQLPPPSSGTPRTQGDVSRIISELWHNESQPVKAEFQQLALIKKSEHETKYPGYKYSPRSKEQRERERRAKSNERNCGASAVPVNSHDATPETGFLSTHPSLSSGPSSVYETTQFTWSQQDIETTFKALQEYLGSSNHHVQSSAHVAHHDTDIQLPTDPLIPDSMGYPSPGEYIPSSYEASFDSMLREFTGRQFDYWQQG